MTNPIVGTRGHRPPHGYCLFGRVVLWATFATSNPASANGHDGDLVLMRHVGHETVALRLEEYDELHSGFQQQRRRRPDRRPTE